MTNIIAIPYISDRMLEVKSKKITPIIEYNGKYNYLGNYNISELKKPLFFNLTAHILDEVDFERLAYLCEIPAYFKTKDNTFKPTLSEIYSQIPNSVMKEACAVQCFYAEPINEEFQKGKLVIYKKS